MTAASDRIAEALELSRPARGPLAAAGNATFVDLANWTRKDIANLHGIGPKTCLLPAMTARGVTFKV